MEEREEEKISRKEMEVGRLGEGRGGKSKKRR